MWSYLSYIGLPGAFWHSQQQRCEWSCCISCSSDYAECWKQSCNFDNFIFDQEFRSSWSSWEPSQSQRFQESGWFVMRLDARVVWHIRGVLLWLLQRPYLRYLPCPYPTVGTIEGWKLQADSMVRSGAYPRRHLRAALIKGAFTMGNLQECCHLRNRLGLSLSFLEDPVLTGMMLAKSAKGLRTTIRNEAVKEAKAAASAAQKAGNREELARELIGPRGGLPTLKKDLLRLAAFLEVELTGKETVDQLKAKVKPAVDLIKYGSGPRKSASSAKSSEESFEVPTTPKALRDRQPQTPQQSPGLSTSSKPEEGVTMEQVQVLMAEQGRQFQDMMSQVMTHMMNIASQPPMTEFSRTSEGRMPDVEMLPVEFCNSKGIPMVSRRDYDEMMQQQSDYLRNVNSPWQEQQTDLEVLAEMSGVKPPTGGSAKEWRLVSSNWSARLGQNMWLIGRQFQQQLNKFVLLLRLNGRMKWKTIWMRSSQWIWPCRVRVPSCRRSTRMLKGFWKWPRREAIMLGLRCHCLQVGIFSWRRIVKQPWNGFASISPMLLCLHFRAHFGAPFRHWMDRKTMMLHLKRLSLFCSLLWMLQRSKRSLVGTMSWKIQPDLVHGKFKLWKIGCKGWKLWWWSLISVATISVATQVSCIWSPPSSPLPHKLLSPSFWASVAGVTMLMSKWLEEVVWQALRATTLLNWQAPWWVHWRISLSGSCEGVVPYLLMMCWPWREIVMQFMRMTFMQTMESWCSIA